MKKIANGEGNQTFVGNSWQRRKSSLWRRFSVKKKICPSINHWPSHQSSLNHWYHNRLPNGLKQQCHYILPIKNTEQSYMQGLYVCAKNEPLYPATTLGRSLLSWIVDPPACFFVCLQLTLWSGWRLYNLGTNSDAKNHQFCLHFFQWQRSSWFKFWGCDQFSQYMQLKFWSWQTLDLYNVGAKIAASTPTWSRLCRYQGRSMSVLAKKNDFRQTFQLFWDLWIATAAWGNGGADDQTKEI